MPAARRSYVLTLDAESDVKVMRVLRALLKYLGRAYGVRCVGLAPVKAKATP